MKYSDDTPNQNAQVEEGQQRIASFEDLECWKACRKLRVFIAKEICPALPKDEKFRMADQMLRAARSTTANIAEGFGRIHHLDNARFCSNSRGSCWELLDHFITSDDENLLPQELIQRGRKLVQHAVRIINGYITYLHKAPTNLAKRK